MTVPLSQQPEGYHYEQGRYLLEGYLLDKSGKEYHRLNMQHEALRLGLGRNYFVPLHRPHTILDIGCGTAIWDREMANTFPLADLTGLDITDVYEHYPDAKRLRPPNRTFVQADALAGLPFPDGYFEYVHARYMAPWVPFDRWPGMLAEMVRVCSPDGWVESFESALPECAGPSYQAVTQAVMRLSALRIGGYMPGRFVAGWMQEAGLEQVRVRWQVAGAGESQRNQRVRRLIGQEIALGYAWSIKPKLVKYGLMDPEELDTHLAAIPAELAEYEPTMSVYITTGRRPKPSSPLH